MELVESIESINNHLREEFGLEWNGWVRWRVVFSKDQYEKRWTHFSDDGIQLMYPQVRLLPKYNYIDNKYVLERLVPAGPETDLIEKITYEPAWTFQDKKENYLPPRYVICKFVIESIYSAINKTGNHTKFKDETMTPEYRKKELEDMEALLFGNETEVGDHLTYGTGLIVPGSIDQIKTPDAVRKT